MKIFTQNITDPMDVDLKDERKGSLPMKVMILGFGRVLVGIKVGYINDGVYQDDVDMRIKECGSRDKAILTIRKEQLKESIKEFSSKDYEIFIKQAFEAGTPKEVIISVEPHHNHNLISNEKYIEFKEVIAENMAMNIRKYQKKYDIKKEFGKASRHDASDEGLIECKEKILSQSDYKEI